LGLSSHIGPEFLTEYGSKLLDEQVSVCASIVQVDFCAEILTDVDIITLLLLVIVVVLVAMLVVVATVVRVAVW